MGSNPVEALKFFSGLNLQLLKLRLQLRWSNLYFICISAVHIIFKKKLEKKLEKKSPLISYLSGIKLTLTLG